MQAMIFAAGLGTRLYPLTLTKPKALVEVGGYPMLRLVIEKMKAAGISRIVVNVHHFADMIIDYLRQNDNFGVDISISDERQLLLDTGGGLLAARNLFSEKEPILIHNADILTDFDLAGMIDRHEITGADATLLTSDRASSRYLLFDNKNRMSGWTNIKTNEVKPADLDIAGLSRKAFGGVHIVSPAIFNSLESYRKAIRSEVFSITPFYISSCADLDLRGYQPYSNYCWFDIGKPENLELARQHVAECRENH